MAGGAKKQLSLTLHGGVKTRGQGAQEGGASEAMPTKPSIQQEQGGVPCDQTAGQELVNKANAMPPVEKEGIKDQQGARRYESVDEYLKDLEKVVRAGVPSQDLLSLLDTMAEVAKHNGAKREDLPEGVGITEARRLAGAEDGHPRQDHNMVPKGERSRLRSACLQSCD